MASRNRGTVCGSLAHADPLAELPCVAIALDARFVLLSVRGRREVPAEEFFVSALSTCLAADELLERIRIPVAPPGVRCAFREIGNRNHGFAVTGLGVQLEMGADGRCGTARIAAFGVGAVALRLGAAERILAGQVPTDAVIAKAAEAAAQAVEPDDDLHATAAHRRRLVAVLVARTLDDLSQDAAA